jgi:site-specific recombinase XerD
VTTDLSTTLQGTELGFSQRPATSRDALAAYLAGLGNKESRRVMLSALHAIALDVSEGGMDAEEFPWHTLGPAHTSVIQARLLVRFGSRRTAQRHVAALRGVLKQCWRLGLMDGDTYQRARDLPPIAVSTLPRGRALEQGEVRALFDACAGDPAVPRRARDACTMALLYGCGLRRAEAAALTVADVNPDTGAVTVRHGKGDKARIAYLPAGGRAALAAWLDVRGKAPGALLWPIRRGGEAMEPRHLSGQALAGILARVADTAQLSQVTTPHDLRRSFISDLLDHGADLSSVQKLVGHATPATTTIYDRRGEKAKQKTAELIQVPYVG